MKHLQTFFTSIAWWTLLPAKDLLTQQPSGDDSAGYISAARSENRDLAVVYMPVGRKTRVETRLLEKRLASRMVQSMQRTENIDQTLTAGRFRSTEPAGLGSTAERKINLMYMLIYVLGEQISDHTHSERRSV